MNERVKPSPSFRRRPLLAAVGVAAFAGPIAIHVALASSSAPVPVAQTTQAAPQAARGAQASNQPTRETFEVASIRLKPFVQGGRGTAGPIECEPPTVQMDPGRISIDGISVAQLIMVSYAEWADARGGCLGVAAAKLLSGGPDWVRSDRWQIQGTVPDGGNDYTPSTVVGPRGRGPLATLDNIGPKGRRMLQSLLADRFKLVLRSETKQIPVYLLTVGKDGFKSNGNPSYAMVNGQPVVLNGSQIGSAKTRMMRRITEADGKYYLSVGIWKMSMPEIAQSLVSTTERAVLDRTNLTGTFDFHLEYDSDGRGGARPTIFKAVEEVGLKLEPAVAPVEVWVIERVEKPEN